MTPEEREERRKAQSIGGRVGALRGWGRLSAEARVVRLSNARAGLLARFEREADPDGEMTPADRAQAGQRLLRAHMSAMSLKSAQARRQRKNPA